MIPFEIPERFLGMIARGAARRIGATIRDTSTGRILAHVQETGRLPALAGLNPAGLILSGGQFVSSVVANVQLEQIRRILGGLQMLTAASLAVSVVGVGVSVAGFGLVVQRLRQLETQIAGVRKDVLAARLATERIELILATRDWTRTESLLSRAEEAWHRTDARDVWRQLDGLLDEEQRYWQGLVGGVRGPSILVDERFGLEQAVAAYEAVLTLASTRIQVLLLVGEMEAGRHHAEELQQWHDRTLLPLTASEIAHGRVRGFAEERGLAEGDARSRLRETGQRFLAGVHEIHLHLCDRPRLLRFLNERGIAGDQYVRELRDRRETPVLTLPYS